MLSKLKALREHLLCRFAYGARAVLSYHTALALLASDRVLYLAVPLDTYEVYFTTAFVQTILDKATINLMVYSVLEEAIVLWRP